MKNKALLEKFIVESIKERPFRLSDGSIVDYGSKNHLTELDRLIKELDVLRKQLTHKRVRKERYTISRAIDSIRHVKRVARRSGIKNGLLKEDD